MENPNEFKLLHFAYGSNLLYDRILLRIGVVKIAGTYVIKCYKLVFNCGINASFANMVYTGDPNDFVEGILYDLDDRQINRLSDYEAFYVKTFLPFTDKRIIYFYQCTDPRYLREGRPSLTYLNLIIDGCIENRLYSTRDKLLAYKNTNYKLKKSKHEKVKGSI